MTKDELAAVTKGLADVTKEYVGDIVQKLEARIAALEDRPSLEYQGVWSSDKVYKSGAAVSWAGSLWVCKNENMGIKPGEGSYESRSWTLAVKRGSPGRDAKDAQ